MIVNPSIKYKEQNPVYHFTDQFPCSHSAAIIWNLNAPMLSFLSWSSDKVFDIGSVAALDDALVFVLPEVLLWDLSPSFVVILMTGVFVENTSFTGYTMTIDKKSWQSV